MAARINIFRSELRFFRLFSVGIQCLAILLFMLPLAAHANRSIRIASIYALSGAAAGANQTSVAGVRMAVEEINASGGVAGHAIELLEFDNQSSPIGSKVAAVKAIQSDVVAIIGAAFSSHSMAVAKVAQKHQVPMITNVSTSPPVTRVGNYIFRVCFNDHLQGRVMAKFARQELNIKGVVTVYNMVSDYSMGIGTTFEQAFVQRGGVVLAKIPYKARQPNFRNLLALAKSAGPDAIYIPGHDESGRIISEAIKSGLDAIPLGGDGWDEHSFYELGGNTVPLGYYTTHWNSEMETGASRRFVARHGKNLTLWAPTALAYDAVNLLVDAIKRAGSSDRRAVREALARTQGYEGVTGIISFDANGDPIKSVVIMKIESGVPTYLKKVDSEYVD